MEDIIRILTPALSARILTSDQREAFERGLTLLEGTLGAAAFVRDSRRFRDYHRRVRQLLTYLQTTQTSRSEIKRHVGRPTREEQAAYAQAQKEKALEEARRSLFPDLQPDLTLQPLTYGGIVANPNGETIASTMPNLMQLRPFLSERLQEQVNSVRSLRNEMAAKSEQAKTMVEANEKAGRPIYTEEEIALLATRAVKIESDILPRIYVSVDREIGEAYLRLSPRTGDPEYIARIEKACNVPPQNLRAQFRPFYDKALARDPLFAQSVADKIAADRPEVKAERDRQAKHKAEADALIKYICRKDKPSTKARVKGLTERIAKLHKDYADIVTEDEMKGYEAILEKTKSEVSPKA
jgi:hypothetical protein